MDEHTPPPEPLTVGSSLRQARTRMGLSLRDLEAITHISRPMLNRLERDRIAQPNPRLLHRLAETLELNSDDLFALAGYRPSAQLPSLAPYLRAKLPAAARSGDRSPSRAGGHSGALPSGVGGTVSGGRAPQHRRS